MEQVHFCGKVRIVGKCAKHVDDRMNDDAWKQTPTAIKNRDQQKTNCNRKNNLAQIVQKIHTTTVEQVDNMSDAKRHTRNNDCRLDIIPCDGFKQQASEDYFLQESNA